MTKNMDMFLWNENDERLSRFVLKCDILLLAGVFEKLKKKKKA